MNLYTTFPGKISYEYEHASLLTWFAEADFLDFVNAPLGK